jgi:general stress protein YciG
MPNNNPQGHNQYTKRKESMPQGTGQPSDTDRPAHSDTMDTMGDTMNTMSDTTSGAASSSGAVSAGPAKRGFAAMDEATQRTIASKGGQSQGKENNPGNFANDRDRAREAGRKGGEAHGTHR